MADKGQKAKDRRDHQKQSKLTVKEKRKLKHDKKKQQTTSVIGVA